MNILVTGGAGFIGRWLVKKLLEKKHNIWIIDDLSNGRKENLEEFKDNPYLKEIVYDTILNKEALNNLFKNKYDIVYHLAANINVQDSIDFPRKTFFNDSVGTFDLLEHCNAQKCKFVLMSTCMVYARASNEDGISETHPTLAASPYAGAKLSAEHMTLSYHYAYGLPVSVIRPFNTYGPFQKTNGEGGVIAIFIKRLLNEEDLTIYGTGEQTRDFLYVEDCVDFIIKAGESKKSSGKIINAGTGKDITINHLAKVICNDESKIKHVKHIHPQSEIQKLLCNYSLAENLLDWKPSHTLEEGIEKTKIWIEENLGKLI